MTDTTPEIARLVHERMMSLTGAVRMRMGADMFTAAQRMIVASFPADLSELERKRRLFERVYGEELPWGALENAVDSSDR